MEVVSISGGLGNQMFQYALFLSKQKNNKNIKFTDSFFNYYPDIHNGFELDRIFNITLNRNNNFFTRKIIWVASKITILKDRGGRYRVLLVIPYIIAFFFIISEKRYGIYDSQILKKRRGAHLYWGHWISEKYFGNIKKDIWANFTFKTEAISDKSASTLHMIENSNSISLHIRRGDYLSEENIILYGNICTIEYYSMAISIIKEKTENAEFFIFSNDIKWVKENLQVDNSHYIDWNEKENSWQDMFLMSKCKHNIIANSTFSWWGAWLNQNPEKIIISPDRFFNKEDAPDLIPDSWIKITT